MKVIYFDLGDTLVTAPRRWLPGAKALLPSLRQKGFRLGIISNTQGLPTRQAILGKLPSDFDLQLFEPTLVLFSSEIGKAKPDREIFDEAVTRAGADPAECLYCSENVVETLMAQHVGMHTIRVQTSPNSDLATFEEDLAAFLARI
jgi:HAD superfamily hydrolase (TIGR01549 family)